MTRQLMTAAFAFLIGITFATAGEFASKDEAVAMVKKATATIKEPKRPMPSSTPGAASSPIVIFMSSCMGSMARCWRTARTRNWSAEIMIDPQDVDGKYFVKERTDLARKQASFWQDYKFVNPTTKKIEPKQ